MKRRKGKNIALVTVYTFVLFLLASVLFSAESLKKEAAQILLDAPEMTVQRLVAGRQDLIPMDYIDSIKEIRGVQSVEPRLWGYYFDALQRCKLHPHGECCIKRPYWRNHHWYRCIKTEARQKGPGKTSRKTAPSL